MTTTATHHRVVVPVDGARALADAVAAEPTGRAAALRDGFASLDLRDAIGTSRRLGRSVLLDPGPSPAIAVRWFAPRESTTVHAHGTAGIFVLLEGAQRYESWIPNPPNGGVTRDWVHWLSPGDVHWWRPPPEDIHRQVAGPAGAAELLVLAQPPLAGPGLDPAANTDELVDAIEYAYRTGDVGPLERLYDRNAVLDITVPHRRFQLVGADSIMDLLRSEELERPGRQLVALRSAAAAKVVSVEVDYRFGNSGAVQRWREAHLLRRRDGLVVEHAVYCSGMWSADEVLANADTPLVIP